jgi:hypothetical protein
MMHELAVIVGMMSGQRQPIENGLQPRFQNAPGDFSR